MNMHWYQATLTLITPASFPHETIDAQTIKNFLRAACHEMRQVPKSRTSALLACDLPIEELVFVKPAHIAVNLPSGQPTTGFCLPGATLEFHIVLRGYGVTEDMLREWLDCGQVHGLDSDGEGARGCFTYTLEESDPVR